MSLPKMLRIAMLIGLVVLTGGPGEAPGQSEDSVTLSGCLVSLIQEAKVPAQEGGILVKLSAQEGQAVAVGGLLAQIDDARNVLAEKAAGLKLGVAQEKAQNDINVRYSKAAADVAKAEYDQALRTNQRSTGSVPETEVRRLLLAARRAVLGIEQADMEFRVTGLEARVAQAEVEAAAEEIRRRKITSPLDGVVVNVDRHLGEWVQPGDAVAHIVRMDRLRVEGFLEANDRLDREGRVTARGYDPAEIDGRPVSVTVRLPRGRQETFQGKVTFVSPLVEAGGQYRFWVEVENRKVSDHWLLRPGLMADMKIHLK
jgi:multidrug efflux pump subunit AcrA (membrane-fusion protein)